MTSVRSRFPFSQPRALAPAALCAAALAVAGTLANAIAMTRATTAHAVTTQAVTTHTAATRAAMSRTASKRAATYYLSPSGSDHDAGTSPRRPWRTLARLDRLKVVPGDRLLLRGGATFAGTLRLEVSGGGSARAPVIIASYGGGRATIAAGAGSGVQLIDSSGVEVRELVVVGDGPSSNLGSGVYALNDLPHARKLRMLSIEDVQASGFGFAGIAVAGRPRDGSQSGFSDVTIENCVVDENRFYGISVNGVEDPRARGYANADVTIRGCRAYDDPGDPDYPQSHSGDGIFLGDVDHGLIYGSVAYDNGASNSCAGCGPVGIWAADANAVDIERSESYENHSGPGGNDGDGFDLDGGTTNCVLQYDYSHDNDGAGFLIYDYVGAPHEVRGNAIRFDLSSDDSRRGAYAALLLGGEGSQVSDTEVYQNTVVLGQPPGGTPSAVEAFGTSDAHFLDNQFVTTGGLPVVYVPAAQPGLQFQGNGYSASGEPLQILYDGESYESLAAWSAATGQEGSSAEQAAESLAGAALMQAVAQR